MKLSALMAAVVLTAAVTGAQAADTLAKIAESGKITLAYRESSVPFSYLDGPSKPIGFSVELSNAVVEAVKKKLNKPNLQVALMPVTSQNRIPLMQNGTIDLECGSTTNNSARGKDVCLRHQPLLHRHAPAGEEVVARSRTTPTSPRRRSPARPAPPTHWSCASTTPRRTSTWTSCSARTMPMPSCWSRATARWPSRWTTSCCSA